MRRKGKLEAIGKLIEQVYPAQEPEEARALRVFAAFTRVVPLRILKNARPVSYKQGLLTVHTANAAWANALSLESAQLLPRLRARLRDIPLQRVVFRVGRLPEVPEAVQPEPPHPRLLPLEALPEELARELAHIADDSLRERVARAMAVSLAEVAPPEPAPRKGRSRL
jgi:hypothetical protein